MGLRVVARCSQPGRFDRGNSDPDRNISGVMVSWTSGMADWTCLTRADRNSPRAQIMKAIRNSSPTSSTIITRSYGTPTSGARARMIRLWRGATVAPPRHLPVRMDTVLTGATSISRRKPNSRSQTMEMPENAAVNSTEVASTPGNRKVRKSTSPEEPISDDRPVPSTNRNSTGWTSEETIRERSRPKRIISRCQTTVAARTWWARPAAGTRTSATGVGLVAVMGSPPPGREGHRAQRTGGLGVADRPAGVGQEDVVEAGPGHGDRVDRHVQAGEQLGHEGRTLGDGEGHRPLVHGRLDAEPVGQLGDGPGVVVTGDLHPVLADAGLEGGRGVQGDDVALVDDGDAVAVLGLVHVVGGDEHGDLLAAVQLLQVVPDGGAGLGVQPDGRLVQEQHPWGVQQAPGDLQPPPHAPRIGLDQVATALPEVDHGQDLLAALGRRGPVDAVQLPVEAQVLLGRQVGVQGRLLEDQADVAPDLVALPGHVEAGHPGRPGGGVGQGAEDLDGGRLPGPVGPEEPEGLPRPHVQVDAGHRLDLLEALDQSSDGDRRGALVHATSLLL